LLDLDGWAGCPVADSPADAGPGRPGASPDTGARRPPPPRVRSLTDNSRRSDRRGGRDRTRTAAILPGRASRGATPVDKPALVGLAAGWRFPGRPCQESARSGACRSGVRSPTGHTASASRCAAACKRFGPENTGYFRDRWRFLAVFL